jgi:hypothetical protein
MFSRMRSAKSEIVKKGFTLSADRMTDQSKNYEVTRRTDLGSTKEELWGYESDKVRQGLSVPAQAGKL